MLAKRIIPCLDVNAGRVVKGVKFLDLRDAGDPVEIAQAYDREGADELCFLDITASHENRSIILDVVARTAEQVFMPLTVGGGINKTEDIRALLKAGADKVSINTGAVNRPEFVQRSRANVRQSMYRRGDRRQTRPATAGKSLLTGGETPRVSMRAIGPNGWNTPAREKFFSPVWTATAPRQDTIWR